MEKDLPKSENKLAANYHRTRMQKEMVFQTQNLFVPMLDRLH